MGAPVARGTKAGRKARTRDQDLALARKLHTRATAPTSGPAERLVAERRLRQLRDRWGFVGDELDPVARVEVQVSEWWHLPLLDALCQRAEVGCLLLWRHRRGVLEGRGERPERVARAFRELAERMEREAEAATGARNGRGGVVTFSGSTASTSLFFDMDEVAMSWSGGRDPRLDWLCTAAIVLARRAHDEVSKRRGAAKPTPTWTPPVEHGPRVAPVALLTDGSATAEVVEQPTGAPPPPTPEPEDIPQEPRWKPSQRAQAWALRMEWP